MSEHQEVNPALRWIVPVDVLYKCHLRLAGVDLENEHCDEVRWRSEG